MSHTLAYSLIALQEMNLAFKYPIMFWNCACLISDAGGNGENSEAENEEDDIVCGDNSWSSSGMVEDFVEFVDGKSDEDDSDDDSEEDGEDTTVESDGSNTKKKKVKSTNYGKVASAIGKIKSSGVNVVPPDINKSTYTFSPDIENNTIRYGLSGITKVGEELVKTIMDGRPYKSVSDFLERVKINKPQMVNLIKSGAFDCFGDRMQIMREYINNISDTKKRITLQNMKMLIDFGLIPEKFDLECRAYNFNKYLKKNKLDSIYYGLDKIAFNFYSEHFDIDNLVADTQTESGFKIKQLTWDKIYQKQMDNLRPYVKDNNAQLLAAVNAKLTQDMWNKYCKGDLSSWEMDSVSFYSHEHELINVNKERYGLVDFNRLPTTPEIDRVLTFKGKQIPLFRLSRICGTVLDRNKEKKTVSLLTTTGVITVKIYGGAFSNYDKQISERGADGKKHVIRKSEFARGNKIIVCGVRDGDSFRAKKYSKTPYHLVETIECINNDGTIETFSRKD